MGAEGVVLVAVGSVDGVAGGVVPVSAGSVDGVGEFDQEEIELLADVTGVVGSSSELI